MSENVQFFSYLQGIITLSPNEIAKAMYKDASVPINYDYKDTLTRLSFQNITPTKLFVVDSDFPVNKLILAAKWQVLYDVNFNAPGNVKFVAMGQDATVQSNWKTLNDVLLYHSYVGPLPLQDLESVYMKLITLDDSMYIVGTLFTPSQPYLALSMTANPIQVIQNSGPGVRIQYNRILDAVGVEAEDRCQMVPVLTGTNVGAVRLKVAGLYLVEATVNIMPSSVPASPVVWDYNMSIAVNGTTRKTSNSVPTQGIGGSSISIMSLVRVTRSQLADIIYPDEARLEVFVQNQNPGGAATVISGDNDTSTALMIAFLG